MYISVVIFIRVPVPVDHETLLALYFYLLCGNSNGNEVISDRPNRREVLQKLYKAADFFDLSELQRNIESDPGKRQFYSPDR